MAAKPSGIAGPWPGVRRTFVSAHSRDSGSLRFQNVIWKLDDFISWLILDKISYAFVPSGCDWWRFRIRIAATTSDIARYYYSTVLFIIPNIWHSIPGDPGSGLSEAQFCRAAGTRPLALGGLVMAGSDT
jgi:hypothetical protein